MRKRGLCCRPVSLSVRPTVTLVHCIHMAEDIDKRLVRSSSPIILVFLIPSAGALNTTGAGKICDFRLKSPFISETVRDRPMVTMDHQ